MAQSIVQNSAGGAGYSFEAKHALAQLAMTGCFNNTFYVSGVNQLDKVLDLAKQCEPEYVAKLAIYARKNGCMKDMPAFLVAYLSTVSPELLQDTFPVVIDNGKMLRNFVQIMRSGAVGRKSLGTALRRLVRAWFDTRTDQQIVRNSVGKDPSLNDVIKMVHPKPANPQRAALYAYFIGKEYNLADLPESLQLYLTLKGNAAEWPHDSLPDVPFELLTGENLSATGWKMLAEQASWSQIRQALNTFHRHGVFSDAGMVKTVADKLRNPELIKRAKVFPYQLMTAYLNINTEIPKEIAGALQDAMEVATENIPVLNGAVYVCPDVSGSMSSAVSGARISRRGKLGATSKVRCIDIAALVAASVFRTNPSAEIIPFEGDIVGRVKLSGSNSVMDNAKTLASIGGGATACSAPLRHLNARKASINTIIYISDNESWKDNDGGYYGWGSSRTNTTMSKEWNKAKQRCPEAKLIAIDVTPNDTSQVNDRQDSLNVGGFSDDVFKVASNFVEGSGQHWVSQIETTSL